MLAPLCVTYASCPATMPTGVVTPGPTVTCSGAVPNVLENGEFVIAADSVLAMIVLPLPAVNPLTVDWIDCTYALN